MNATPPAANALGELGSDAFLKLLVAQLKYQDPMAPADGAAMLQQTAQFTQVETMKQLASLQQQLMGLQQTAMASDLIGREVSAVTEDGREVAGTVEGVRFTDVGPRLLIGGEAVPFDGAREIRQA
ncbi:MAG: flagellar hook capping protein [Actinobacteria bacterium]|nr:flagellar hook capping protein [Actinomycetota bacterium]